MLTDNEQTIASKIKAAVTDSIDGITYEPERRPGVSNLLDILYHCTDGATAESQQALAEDLKNISMRSLKEKVADAVEQTIRPIRERYLEVLQDQTALDDAAAIGAEKARASASTTLVEVKKAIGLP